MAAEASSTSTWRVPSCQKHITGCRSRRCGPAWQRSARRPPPRCGWPVCRHGGAIPCHGPRCADEHSVPTRLPGWRNRHALGLVLHSSLNATAGRHGAAADATCGVDRQRGWWWPLCFATPHQGMEVAVMRRSWRKPCLGWQHHLAFVRTERRT
jgi:hypothetical protein